MIPVPNYEAEFAVHDGSGRKAWRACTVVGVSVGDAFNHQFVVIIRGPTEYVDTVDEVRRRLPSAEPFA